MEEIERLREDVREGRIDAERLVDLVVMLQRRLRGGLAPENEELEKKLGRLADGQSRGAVFSAFRRAAAGGPGEAAAETEASLAAEGSPCARRLRWPLAEAHGTGLSGGRRLWGDCHLSHTRPVWRLEEGRAVLVAYQVYRGPRNQYGQISGVLGSQ
jgi:hypothetical protein